MLSQTLSEKSRESVTLLDAAQRAGRLRLALAGAREAAFDWSVAEDSVVWEGATDLISPYCQPELLARGGGVRAWMGEAGRAQIRNLVENASTGTRAFGFEFEARSALGPEWFEMQGMRIAGADGAAERLVGLLRIVTERVSDARRLHYLATRDELTGHLNRTSLRSRLSKVIAASRAESHACAYFVVAIDRLSAINDAYGFGASDEAIVEIGERLSAALPDNGDVGRIAGNKFGAIAIGCGERDIACLAGRLQAAIRDDPVFTRGGPVSATVSLGAICLPADAASSQEAMLRAEEALDLARSAGLGGFAVYAQSSRREAARLKLMAIADEVAAAVHQKRLFFAYQPIVDAATRKPVHHECLLRMTRADGTIAGAEAFIPAAERLGLVRSLDRYALETAVAALRKNPNPSLAVNLSAIAAADCSWMRSFVDYLRANRDVAPRTIVEITETAVLRDVAESARFVWSLRNLGCRVAIDDFGAGYTSFRNLQMLKVDMVKIDGSFVRNLSRSPDNRAFVRTLADLARSLGLETVAEWVSSEEDAALLEELGVDYLQGFHTGRPRMQLA